MRHKELHYLRIVKGRVTSLDTRTRRDTPEAPQEVLIRAKQGDVEARNRLIQDYTPFVLKVASQKVGRFLRPGTDDEVSVALLAFNEAIDAYDNARGSFLSFSQTVIQRRLVDYFRRHRGQHQELMLADLEGPREDQHSESTVLDQAAKSAWGLEQDDESRRREIEEYGQILARFGIRFADLVRAAPKHRDSRDRVINLARAAVQEPEDQQALVERGELPTSALVQKFGVSRRLIERHRVYIVAVAVILTHDLPYLQEYLWDRG